MRVAIVRPKTSWQRLVVTIGLGFLNALFLMLILGAVSPWHPSFWTTYLVLWGAQILRGPSTAYLDWTWPGRKGDAS